MTEICVPLSFLKASLKMIKESEKKKLRLFSASASAMCNPYDSLWLKGHILYCGNNKLVLYHLLSSAQVPAPLLDEERYTFTRQDIEDVLSDPFKKKQSWVTIELKTVKPQVIFYVESFERILFEYSTNSARDLPEISPMILAEVAEYLVTFKDSSFMLCSTSKQDMLCFREEYGGLKVAINFITKL